MALPSARNASHKNAPSSASAGSKSSLHPSQSLVDDDSEDTSLEEEASMKVSAPVIFAAGRLVIRCSSYSVRNSLLMSYFGVVCEDLDANCCWSRDHSHYMLIRSGVVFMMTGIQRKRVLRKLRGRAIFRRWQRRAGG
jgi:hypothetical protein